MVDQDLLDILACPETKKDLELADEQLVKKVNDGIKEGKVSNRAQEKVTKAIEGGLLRKDDPSGLYPIRDGIPILLVEEFILLNNIT